MESIWLNVWGTMVWLEIDSSSRCGHWSWCPLAVVLVLDLVLWAWISGPCCSLNRDMNQLLSQAAESSREERVHDKVHYGLLSSYLSIYLSLQHTLQHTHTQTHMVTHPTGNDTPVCTCTDISTCANRHIKEHLCACSYVCMCVCVCSCALNLSGYHAIFQ